MPIRPTRLRRYVCFDPRSPTVVTKTRLLILGAPRSGTTLLTGMVGAHPKVAMLCEDLAFSMRHLISKPVVGNKLCIPNQIDLEPSLFSRISSRFGYGIFKRKSVVSIRGHLKDESMKLITIIRDPHAIVSSIMRRGEHDFEEAALRWKRSIDIISDLHDQEHERTLLITFENLVQDPEATMKLICEFTDLEFDFTMLDGYKGRPYSNKGGIKAEKARKDYRATSSFNLETIYPESYGAYRSILENLTTTSPRKD